MAGDTEDIPEMQDLKDIDIAFLLVNQPYTMTVPQADRATLVIKPNVLYPYHYGGDERGRIEIFLDKEIRGRRLRILPFIKSFISLQTGI